MLLLKRFDESLFNDENVYDDKQDKFLTVKEGIELISETPASHYREYVLETLMGLSSVNDGVGELKSVFLHSVEDKHRSSVPRVLIHNVYFRHINPLQSGIVDSYIFPKKIAQENEATMIAEIRKVVRSIRKPELKMIDEDLYIWLNKTLFNYSSKLIKVDLFFKPTEITAYIRYVQPDEVNPDIGILCRRDGRFRDNYQDIVRGEDVLGVNDNYFRCGGLLNIRQIIQNSKFLSNSNVLPRIAEMKVTGYPHYATLQNGIAVLGNILTNNVNTTGLTSFETCILQEGLKYTPWVRR